MEKRRFRISKRSIIIAAIIIILLGIPALAFLVLRDQGTPSAWFNTNWLYRKALVVNNPGGTKLDEDVLITIDTAALITAGKLQSNCADLRFVNSDDASILSYWIEAGCNTSTTNIWVRVPYFTSGDKTIYQYYGNASATAGESSWTGNFIILSDTSCATGWTRVGDLDNRFPRGATAYGTTGGSTSHSHTVSGTTASSGGGTLTNVSTGTSQSPDQYNHSHSFSGNGPSVTHTPPYRDMIFCKKAKLDIPTNSILIFNTTSVADWTRFSALDNVFPRGAAAYGTSTAGASSHTHTFTFNNTGTGGGAGSAGACTENCLSPSSPGHYHQGGNSSTPSATANNNIPPYLEVIYMKKDTAGILTNERPIAIINIEDIPIGWERFVSLDSKFPRGSATYGANSSTSVHTHSGSRSTGTPSSTQLVLKPGDRTLVSGSHTHSMSWTSNSPSHLPPYLNVVYVQRKQTLSITSVSLEEEYDPDTPPPDPTADEWYSKDWLHRQRVVVNNPTATQIDAEVLISLDTSTLISEGKMKSDCSDVRAVDSDNETLLEFWIEGGCNSTQTQIWVRVPSLPNGLITIYLYYANPSSTNGEVSWSGNFILMSENSCPTNWTRNEDFDGKFIYGSDTYGISGGDAGSHNHGGAFTVQTGNASSTGGIGGNVDSWCYNLQTAKHTISATRGNANNVPQYTTTILCNRDKLTDISSLILISDTETPTGWTRNTSFDNRFPYGSTTHGTTGGTASHTHTISSISTGSSAQECSTKSAPNPNQRTVSRNNHVHTSSVSSNPATTNLPPYKALLFVQIPSDTPSLTERVLAMSSVLPPIGWDRYSDLDNVFVRGSSTVNLTEQGSQDHSHVVNFSTGSPSATININASSYAAASDSHTHTASHTSSTHSNLPPYLTTIYSKRKVSLATSLQTEETANLAPNQPSELLTIGEINPTSIMNLVPYFSAIFSDPENDDTGYAYQVQVNTSSDFLGSVIWDSEKIVFTSSILNEDRSPNIQYAGTTLTYDGTTYYWRIKFWDDKNNESEWSETATFSVNATPSSPTPIFVNGLVNPQTVHTLKPYFTSVFLDTDNENSSAYQIQVNTDILFVDTVMWDSGKTNLVVSNNEMTPQIVYDGIESELG
jgi:hypothetical protein